jgi:hypothetical protein
LAIDWDTLGWVRFRAGDTASAQKYAEAAWLLYQHAVIGEHLLEIYEKLGKKQDAGRICHLALAAYGKDDEPDTRNKLAAAGDRLGVSKSDSMTVNAKAFKPPVYGGIELSEMRSVKISFPGDLPAQSKSATFAITIVNGQKTALVNFIEGAEELRPAVKTLAAAKYPQAFPDDTPVKLVLQGLLSCSKFSKGCLLVFFPMETIAGPPPSPFQ